jgi:hypothetical protein
MENSGQIQQWYSLLSEHERHLIFAALSTFQRRSAFEYGLTVTWARLPQYARDLVTDEWHARGLAND